MRLAHAVYRSSAIEFSAVGGVPPGAIIDVCCTVASHRLLFPAAHFQGRWKTVVDSLLPGFCLFTDVLHEHGHTHGLSHQPPLGRHTHRSRHR